MQKARYCFGLIASLLTGMLAGPPAQANETRISHGIFNQIESHVLDNGLHVILAPRASSDSVMLQLVVDVGLRDFPCDKQQIPHVIEHLLFENNTRYSPEELRNRIRNLGGYSNGWTTDETTFYAVSIHSDYEQQAISTLLTMVRDLRWDEADMLRVKRIVDSELETPVSPIQAWFDSKRPVVETAKGRLYPGSTLECTQRSAAEPLSTQEIRDAYNTFYHAGNMTLIILGSLSPDSLQWVRNEFGQLPAATGTAVASGFQMPPLEQVVTTEHTPMVEKSAFGSASAWVNLLTRMPGTNDPDFAVAQIITEYFTERLFAEVRLKYGLGYTPVASLMAGNDSSVLLASTKTRSDLHHLTEQVFMQVYGELRSNGINVKDLRRLKRKLILRFEARERDALELAELYRQYRNPIRQDGQMPNLVAAYEAVTPADIQRVTARYLPEHPVVAILRPPSQLEAILAVTGIILGAAILGLPMHRWLRRRHLHHLHHQHQLQRVAAENAPDSSPSSGETRG